MTEAMVTRCELRKVQTGELIGVSKKKTKGVQELEGKEKLHYFVRTAEKR